MERPNLIRLSGTCLLVGVAGYLVIRGFARSRSPGELAFFYDLSAGKLFTAPRDAVPPIRGIDGTDEDAYRATVISPNGHPRDRTTWQVAYLERFSPELKRLTEAAQGTGTPLAMGRMEAQSHRFVRSLKDSEWHPMNSPEAESILNAVNQAGPDGALPIVCTP